ncbi:MAG TPA: hypothetical protein VKT80_01745, partial [Chloroflexota bacterium]|nr:hypothetical protein [Chloroflexota bacterium]
MTLAARLRIERDLQDGAIDAAFCTTTLASGIDAPVRSVVLGALNDGLGRPLPPSVVQQMAGRAGRRSRDSVGFVIAVPPTSRDLKLVDAMRMLSPQPIDSAFEASYQTVLRVVAQRGVAGVLDLASRSFATFQNREFIASLRSLVAQHSSDLETSRARLQPRRCEDPAVTWPRYVADEMAFSRSRSPYDAERLQAGYLCGLGIAFAKNPRKNRRVLILTPGGDLVEKSHAPLPLASGEEIETEVRQIVRSLLDVPTAVPDVGKWFAFGSPDGGRSIEQVVSIRGDRVSFGGEGTYAFARLTGKRVHALDPARFGSRVAALLTSAAEPSIESVAEAALAADPIPCPTCPAFARCPEVSDAIRVAQEARNLVQEGLWRADPEARVTRIVRALEKLGALDPGRHPTALGHALLATHDPVGLFFAMSRERLGRLSPERLALVVAATREIRVGHGPGTTDLLPGFYVDLVTEARDAEVSANGVDTLATLRSDAERRVDQSGSRTWRDPWSRPVSEDDDEDADDEIRSVPTGTQLSFADRRAYVFERLWSGHSIDTVGIAPGDAERLFLDVIATLHDLREISQYRESAQGAIEHLRSLADEVLAASS